MAAPDLAVTTPGLMGETTTDQTPNDFIPFLLLDLPPELRSMVYDNIIPSIDTLVLTSSGRRLISAASHPVGSVSHAIRDEFLDRLAGTHGATSLITTTKDFNLARTIKFLRNTSQNGSIIYITIRHDVTTPNLDTERLTAWLVFAKKRPGLSTQHDVVGLPVVPQRRAMQLALIDFGEGVQGELPGIVEVVKGFGRQWRAGQGEMQWASEGETDPREKAGTALGR